MGKMEENAMGKLGAIAVAVAVIAPLPAMAYSQEDVNACTSDVMRLCVSAIPDATRVTQCLVQNKPRLSSACHTVFSRPHNATPVERQTKAQATMY
jgi:hypothetical protein